MCLMQQIVSEASSHAVSEGFSRDFAFLLVVNRLFWELTDNCSSKSIFTESDSVQICGPMMAVAVDSTIPGEHVGGSESKAECRDDFDHII